MQNEINRSGMHCPTQDARYTNLLYYFPKKINIQHTVHTEARSWPVFSLFRLPSLFFMSSLKKHSGKLKCLHPTLCHLGCLFLQRYYVAYAGGTWRFYLIL